MNSLSLNFLGPPRFERGGVSVGFARAKGVALLLYLGVMRGAQQRERLLDMLWPESLPQAARKNMRNTLWAIGEALGDDVLVHDGATIRLASAVAVDIHGLEDGLLLLESGSVAMLEAATAHYQGQLADGLVLHEAPEFELWLASERERLAAVYLRLLEKTIALHLAAGNWAAVIAHGQRGVAADPLRESLHLALIEGFVRAGQRGQAVQQYAALAGILRRELDVAPLPETADRYEALLAGAPRLAVSAARPARLQEPPAPFVGRGAELDALDEELDRAAQGTARVALITGELGMGKTQLWRTWAETRAADGLVLATHALDTGEPVPFGPLLALFGQPGPARAIVEPPSPLAPIWLAELARLLPGITAAWPALPPPLALSPAEERARLFQALTEALRLIAQPMLVLVIDDLHWADPSTLDWLVYMIDQLEHTPLLVIGTYRLQDAPERLVTTVAGWQRQRRLRQIPLPHLTTEESDALLLALGVAADGQQGAEWVHQSGGNPYFLIELQRAGEGAARCDLAALVRARVQATVPLNALQVLQAAAVLGDNAAFATLRATSGRSEEETLDALDALVAAAVLVPQEQEYRFVHPLVATIVGEDLGPARRAFLHRRAAEALQRLYAPHPERVAGQLMGHYQAAGERDRAAHYAELAAVQALVVGALVEAAAYARRALEWEPSPERHLLLGQSLMLAGSASAAQQQLEAALRGFEQLANVVGATRACLALALMAIGTSQPLVARAWLARAPVAQAQFSDPALGVQSHLLAASIARQSQAYDTAAAQLDQAAQLARQHALSEEQLHIAFERGNLLANRGDLPAALAAFNEALVLSQLSANRVHGAMVENNLAYHSLLAGDSAAAQAHIRAAAELAEQYGLSFLWQYIHSTSGEIAFALGDHDTADASFAQAFEAAQSWGNRVHMANVRADQALVAQARGGWARARTLLAEARDLLGAAPDPFVREKIEQAGRSDFAIGR